MVRNEPAYIWLGMDRNGLLWKNMIPVGKIYNTISNWSVIHSIKIILSKKKAVLKAQVSPTNGT